MTKKEERTLVEGLKHWTQLVLCGSRPCQGCRRRIPGTNRRCYVCNGLYLTGEAIFAPYFDAILSPPTDCLPNARTQVPRLAPVLPYHRALSLRGSSSEESPPPAAAAVVFVLRRIIDPCRLCCCTLLPMTPLHAGRRWLRAPAGMGERAEPRRPPSPPPPPLAARRKNFPHRCRCCS